MKKQTNRLKRNGFLSIVLCAALCGTGAALGQDPGNGPGGPWGPGGQGGQEGQGGQGGPGGNRRPPLPPVFQALDTNHDGIIEPDEIANAAQSLKTLLKSGTNSLTPQDLLGPPRGRRPQGRGGPWGGNGGGPGGGGADMQLANPGTTGTAGGAQGNNGQNDPPGPPPGQDGPRGPGGPGGPGGHRPLPPVIQALDANHDGIIDANEIANAVQALKSLLKPGSNQLTIPDLLGPPRGPRPGGQGQDGPPPNGPDGSGGPGGADQPDGNPPPPPPPQ